MPLHETLAQFADIVRLYEVLQYDVEGLNSRLKLRISFLDDSHLYVREIVLAGQLRKYAYHWQNAAGQMRRRWDNAEHWPQIAAHPHHQYVGSEDIVVVSNATTLEEVLSVIHAQLESVS